MGAGPISTAQLGTGLLILLALVLLPGSSTAWARQGPDRNPGGARTPAAQGRHERQAGPRSRGNPQVGRNPQAGANAQAKQEFVRRLSALPPDQQEQLLRNSAAFQNLPAPEQQRILEGVRHWNAAGRPPGQLQEMIEHQHAPGFFEQLRGMPPEEQERVMQNDARFQTLPPERQQQIRQNLNRWNAATPEERQLLLQREQIVQSFSPQQRDQLRQVFPRYRQLTPERRQAVMQNFLKLRDLPAAQRERFLSSPEVQQLAPEERGILRDLKSLLPEK